MLMHLTNIQSYFLSTDNDSLTEKVGKNTFTDQKFHHRCRRKKNESRIIDSMR